MSQFEQIQQTLLEIYKKNINYFKIYNRSLHNKVISFEKLNIENFYIDFENNHFELKNIDGTSIYNCDPFYDAQYRVENIKNPNYLELIQKNSTTTKVHYDDSINAYEQILLYNKFIEIDNINDKIKKFIFSGTLLGVHINDIVNQLGKLDAVLIAEKNIEIFRLSMFLCDYETICKKKKVFFLVDFTKNELQQEITKFLSYKYWENHFIQYEVADKSNIELLNNISIEISQQSQMTYPYSEYLVSMKRGYEYFKRSKNGILNTNELNKLLINKHVLYIGAGPSVASKLEWLYKNQDKFIIVAASAILKRLELLNIIPNIIITIDGQKDQIKEQYNVNKDFYSSSIILASIKLDPEVFQTLESKNTFYIQTSFELFEGYGITTGVTVGDIGIKLIEQFGCKELYLLGFDACIGPVNQKTHDSLHRGSRKIDLNHTSNSYDRKLIDVKGNLRESVTTFIYYTGMIDNISSLLKNSNMKVYNLSDGAYFEYSVPCDITKLDLSNIQLINKTEIHENIIDLFTLNSKKSLSQKDISYIKKELKIIKKIKNSKIDNLNIEIAKLQSNFLNSTVLQLLEKYLLLTSPYATVTKKYNIQKSQFFSIVDEVDNIYKSL